MNNKQIATVSIKKTDWYGYARNNYTYFNDKHFLPISLFNYKITKVKIWYGNIYKDGVINGIQFFYCDRTTKMLYPTRENYGALYLIDTKEYDLAEDEYLTSFTIQASSLIKYLSFTTNKKRVIKQGSINHNAQVYSFPFSNTSFIIGMKGFYSNFLNKIAFYYAKKDYYLENERMNHSTASCTCLYGDLYLQGTWFNDKEILKNQPFKYRIAKIIFWIGNLYHSNIINGIQFIYCKKTNGKIIDANGHQGKNNEIAMKEYELENNEYISHYRIRASYLVQYIEFTTNKGRLIQEGEKVGKEPCESQFEKDDNMIIVGMRGQYNGDLQNIGFYYSNVSYYEKIGKFYSLKKKLKDENDHDSSIGKYKDDLSTLALIKTVVLCKPFLCRNILTYLSGEEFPIFGNLFLGKGLGPNKSYKNLNNQNNESSGDMTPTSVDDLGFNCDTNRQSITPSFSFAFDRKQSMINNKSNGYY